MDKSDLQEQFKDEQDREAVAEFSHGKIYLPAYGEWCERKVLNFIDKAEAYDRLMSGKPTLKELANILQMAITINPEPEAIVKGFRHTPNPVWFENGEDSFGGWLAQEKYIFKAFESTTLFPPGLIGFTGDWKDSLTLPDGWETKGENK